MTTTKPINSQIEELKKVIDKVPKSAFRTGLTRLQIKKIYNMGFQKGKQEAQKEELEFLEELKIVVSGIGEINMLKERIKQLARTLADNNHSPSQQISVDKREIDVIKQISNVGENPTLDTSYLGGYAEYKDDDEVKKC